jgi:alkaline phosphatase D
MREESQQRFLEFMGAAKDDPRYKRPGVYSAYTFGSQGRRIQVILLDTRYFRGAPGDTAVLLGEVQWTWLNSQLHQPADLRIIGSGMQVLSTKPNHDTWFLYPAERQRLLGLLDDLNVAGHTVFISGDIHFTEALAGQTPAGKSVTEFTSSGLTHKDALASCCYDSLSITGPVSARNFGLMTVDWEYHQVTFSGNGLDGRTLVSTTTGFSSSPH